MENKVCKKCGRKLTNQKSIELGYGKQCYKIIQLEQEKPDLINEISFLKMELNFLKKQFRELKNSGILLNTAGPIEKIERIKKEPETPEKIENKVNFNFVVNELKIIFQNTNGDIKKILKHIEPRNEPEIIELTKVRV